MPHNRYRIFAALFALTCLLLLAFWVATPFGITNFEIGPAYAASQALNCNFLVPLFGCP